MTKGTATVLGLTFLATLGMGLLLDNQVSLQAEPPKEKAAKAQEAAEWKQHLNNLKRMGIAMHEYHDVHKHWIRHAIYDKNNQTPLLSWRVILPYLGEKALYEQFKLDEAWDSPHNKKLIAKIPKVYEPLGVGKKGMGLTHYQVFTGPETIFDGPKMMRLTDTFDGTSNTILVMEAKIPVVWTQPEDLRLLRRKERMPPLGGLFKGGIGVLMCDGSVHTFRLNPPHEELRAAITPQGGEVIDFDKLEK